MLQSKEIWGNIDYTVLQGQILLSDHSYVDKELQRKTRKDVEIL